MSSSLITRPLSMGELLDVTFRIYRKHFWKLVLTAGGLIIPMNIISEVLGFAQNRYYFGGGVEAFMNGETTIPFWITGLQVIVGFATLFIALLTGAAIIWMVNRIIFGEAPGVVQSWRAGLRYLLPYLAVALLLGLAAGIGMIGLIILAIIPCLGFFLMIGGIVFFFYLYVRLILSPMALIIDDIGPIDAIKAAWRASKGAFWRIAGYGLLLAILAFVFYIGPLLLMEYWMLSSAVNAPESVIGIATALGFVINIINILWTPLYIAALVLLYHDLKLRNQPGAAIEQRIAALEAAPLPAASPETAAPSQPGTIVTTEEPPAPLENAVSGAAADVISTPGDESAAELPGEDSGEVASGEAAENQ